MMQKKNKLRIGLIGAGGIARGEHLPAWASVPFAEVVAVADPSPQALEKTLTKQAIPHVLEDWQKLLELDNLDAVDICTPNQLHAPMAQLALNRRLHVLCEKPLATTSAEVQALQQAAQQSGKILMTAQHMRFRPSVRGIRGLIQKGMLGDVYYTRAQWLRRRMLPPSVTFIDRANSGGGPCFDIGVHMLDLAYWLLGCPQPTRVSAMTGTYLAQRPDLGSEWGDWDRSRMNVEDFATAMIRFANGATLNLETSWLSFQPEAETIRLQCYGTQGGLLWPEGVLTGESNQIPWHMQLDAGEDRGAYKAEIQAFAKAIQEGLPSPVPVEETLEVIRILEACYESSRLKREVELTADPAVSVLSE